MTRLPNPRGGKAAGVFLCARPVRAKRASALTLRFVSAAERELQDSAEKARRAQLAKRTEVDDLLWLMGDKRGRRFMWRLLEQTGIYRPSYVPGLDAMQTTYREGERNVGLRLLAAINEHCVERLSEMQKETRSK